MIGSSRVLKTNWLSFGESSTGLLKTSSTTSAVDSQQDNNMIDLSGNETEPITKKIFITHRWESVAASLSRLNVDPILKNAIDSDSTIATRPNPIFNLSKFQTKYPWTNEMSVAMYERLDSKVPWHHGHIQWDRTRAECMKELRASTERYQKSNQWDSEMIGDLIRAITSPSIRDTKINWKAIAEPLGVTVTDCKLQYYILTYGKESFKDITQKPKQTSGGGRPGRPKVYNRFDTYSVYAPKPPEISKIVQTEEGITSDSGCSSNVSCSDSSSSSVGDNSSISSLRSSPETITSISSLAPCVSPPSFVPWSPKQALPPWKQQRREALAAQKTASQPPVVSKANNRNVEIHHSIDISKFIPKLKRTTTTTTSQPVPNTLLSTAEHITVADKTQNNSVSDKDNTVTVSHTRNMHSEQQHNNQHSIVDNNDGDSGVCVDDCCDMGYDAVDVDGSWEPTTNITTTSVPSPKLIANPTSAVAIEPTTQMNNNNSFASDGGSGNSLVSEIQTFIPSASDKPPRKQVQCSQSIVSHPTVPQSLQSSVQPQSPTEFSVPATSSSSSPVQTQLLPNTPQVQSQPQVQDQQASQLQSQCQFQPQQLVTLQPLPQPLILSLPLPQPPVSSQSLPQYLGQREQPLHMQSPPQYSPQSQPLQSSPSLFQQPQLPTQLPLPIQHPYQPQQPPLTSKRAPPTTIQSICEIYRQHDPSKMREVPTLLSMYKGYENLLLQKIVKQYGAIQQPPPQNSNNIPMEMAQHAFIPTAVEQQPLQSAANNNIFLFANNTMNNVYSNQQTPLHHMPVNLLPNSAPYTTSYASQQYNNYTPHNNHSTITTNATMPNRQHQTVRSAQNNDEIVILPMRSGESQEESQFLHPQPTTRVINKNKRKQTSQTTQPTSAKRAALTTTETTLALQLQQKAPAASSAANRSKTKMFTKGTSAPNKQHSSSFTSCVSKVKAPKHFLLGNCGVDPWSTVVALSNAIDNNNIESNSNSGISNNNGGSSITHNSSSNSIRNNSSHTASNNNIIAYATLKDAYQPYYDSDVCSDLHSVSCSDDGDD